MQKHLISILFLAVFFISCKKDNQQKNILENDPDPFKTELLIYLSIKLDELTFSQLDFDNAQFNSSTEAQRKAIVYFKKESNRKKEFVNVLKTGETFTSDLILLNFRVTNPLKNYISGTIEKTNLETQKQSKRTFTTEPGSISSASRTNDDPVQLQEIIIIGLVGQSQFIINAFIDMQVAGNISYQSIYLNSQTESVLPPGEYGDYNIPPIDVIAELEFNSIEEVAAFQLWLNNLSPAELALCLENPVAALQIYRNSNKALIAFPQWNGIGDAKRHAYWMALNAKDPFVGPLFATRFGIAHETGAMPSTLLGKPFGHQQWQLEIQSDLHNNTEGIGIITLMMAAGQALTDINILNWINNYATPGGAFTYLCDPTPNESGSGDEVLRFSNQSCP